MIIARSAGRLGNQLFVMAALRKVTGTDESLVLVGFEDLVQTFPEILRESRHIPLPRQHWSLWNLVEKVLTFLGTLRVVSVITSHPTERRLVKQRGLFPLALFRGGWCQDEQLVDPTISQALFESFTNDSVRAENWDSLSLPATQENPVFFIHIRRGDYLSWPTPDFPAALPQVWYRDAMETIQESHPGARFLVFSDDPVIAAEFAQSTGVAVAVEANSHDTFAYMSACTGGILSASSFSWWGAWLASRQSPGPFIAPLHWITWGESRWDDSHSLQDTSFLTWMPVDASST